MKKTYYFKYLRLQLKREKKRFKRKRKSLNFIPSVLTESKETNFKKKHDYNIVSNYSFQLNDFLDDRGNKPKEKLTSEIKITEAFSFEKNYDKTILKLALIRKSVIQFIGQKIIINFNDCNDVDFSALFLLKVILDEYIKELRKLDSRLLIYKALPNIRIRKSLNKHVNLKLLSNKIINNVEDNESDFVPVSVLNMIEGRKNQKHYTENKKGSAVTKIRNYINDGLRRHNYELNPKGEGYLDGIISEILNNAEDHSKFDKWYVFANIFETKKTELNKDIVSELNLAFLNFGYSIYEGFEDTKDLNHQTFNDMQNMARLIQNDKNGENFTNENLFTLYALQEGNSRLKYSEESRGTGTMKFINSFLNLGDYEDNEKGFHPNLLIFSGNTMLKCDNKYKPFKIDGAFYLSLNSNNDMTKPPEKTHLQQLKSRFPGTLLTGKIYLNENHLNKQNGTNGNENYKSS